VTAPRRPAGRRISADAALQLTVSTEPWLSCEDCFRLVDLYAEAYLRDPATPGLTAMAVHLKGCAACAEEAESLIQLLTQDGAGR